MFKITRAKTLESLTVLRNTVSQQVDPEQWKALDQQTKLWIQQFNRLDLIGCSLGELKAPIRLQIDQPKLDSGQPSSRWLRAYLMTSLGGFYSALGHCKEALEVARRAVEIYERLSAKNPDAFEPDLAMSLGTLDSISRDNDDALAAATFVHGIQVLSRLFFQMPMAFDPLMFKLCNAYVLCCKRAGQDPDEELLVSILEKLEALGSASSVAD
ncbi:hypothetical protein SAMN06296273_1316 [Nitrosomonas ureae]|uniref:Tetratricopeptide repeat protein n=1 Tax=Nitrosomonas ureae TaxID=44577 RepID=A0A285BYI9_9PROT|nr:tetratricopeptide repeat protein [Nitrosomonas ureae]SNX59873.1 hypothetical protein SAMN06296273_1316 [Nitrosomonas ureae]